MLEFTIDDSENLETNNTKCKGLFYRYTTSNFLGSSGSFVFKQEFRPLKRLSCREDNCAQCLSKHELLNEWDIGSIIVPDDIESGTIVKLEITNIHTDWESGIVDDYDFEFIKVN